MFEILAPRLHHTNHCVLSTFDIISGNLNVVTSGHITAENQRAYQLRSKIYKRSGSSRVLCRLEGDVGRLIRERSHHQTCIECSLPGRCLAHARRENITHDALVDISCGYAFHTDSSSISSILV